MVMMLLTSNIHYCTQKWACPCYIPFHNTKLHCQCNTTRHV